MATSKVLPTVNKPLVGPSDREAAWALLKMQNGKIKMKNDNAKCKIILVDFFLQSNKFFIFLFF